MKYYKNKKNRILLSNIFSLASLQALNYLLPILILPFLVRSIGIGNIGVISTAFAISIYFQMFGEYGFNLTATKEVARQRDDITYINKLFSAVLYIKIIFLLIGFLIYICVVELIPEYSHSFLIFLFTYLITIGQTLFPTWLFQGFEKMKFITIINGLTKISGAVITIFIVKTPSDSFLVPLINGIFAIIGTLLAFIVA
ncbi:oligosaccharide flippase family protein, partial [Enterobacter hormaechei]|nr:oligosaccharide flippase family protein [Enterobacter hormaechei]